MTNRSQRWNILQICPRRDSNSGGSDLWANALLVRPRRRPVLAPNKPAYYAGAKVAVAISLTSETLGKLNKLIPPNTCYIFLLFSSLLYLTVRHFVSTRIQFRIFCPVRCLQSKVLEHKLGNPGSESIVWLEVFHLLTGGLSFRLNHEGLMWIMRLNAEYIRDASVVAELHLPIPGVKRSPCPSPVPNRD